MITTFTIDLMLGIGIGVAVGFIVTQARIKLYSSKSRIDQIDLLNRRVKDALKSIVDGTRCDNAILMHIHNGRGELLAFRTIYSSVLIEAVEPDSEMAVKKIWQSVEADEQYFDLLKTLKAAKWTHLETDTMPNGTLRRLYRSKGIQGSVIFYVHDTTSGGPYYVTCPTRSEMDKLIGSDDYVQIEMQINRIKRLLREADLKGIIH
jgi:hypothetical protein